VINRRNNELMSRA